MSPILHDTGGLGCAPPCAYNMQRIWSISGWYCGGNSCCVFPLSTGAPSEDIPRAFCFFFASCQSFFATIHSASTLQHQRCLLEPSPEHICHEDAPPDSSHLPPLRASNDALGHLLAAERLDEVCRSLVARGHRHEQSDDVHPRRAGGSRVREGLQLFYCVPDEQDENDTVVGVSCSASYFVAASIND